MWIVEVWMRVLVALLWLSGCAEIGTSCMSASDCGEGLSCVRNGNVLLEGQRALGLCFVTPPGSGCGYALWTACGDCHPQHPSAHPEDYATIW